MFRLRDLLLNILDEIVPRRRLTPDVAEAQNVRSQEMRFEHYLLLIGSFEICDKRDYAGNCAMAREWPCSCGIFIHAGSCPSPISL